MRSFKAIRIARTAAALLGLAVLIIGVRFWAGGHNGGGAWIYWGGLTLLAGLWFWQAALRPLALRWNWEQRLLAVLPGLGGELSALKAAAVAIKVRQEERALYILEHLQVRSGNKDVAQTCQGLAALARASWLARQRPPRPLALHHRFPQLHALVFSGGAAPVPLRQEALARELAEAAPADLDALAQEYIRLHDVLVPSLGRKHKPFAAEAEELLAFTTGRATFFGTRGHYALWWGKFRPVLARGGGAVLVGVRLLQREAHEEAARLLTALAAGGVLSAEGETLRRRPVFYGGSNARNGR